MHCDFILVQSFKEFSLATSQRRRYDVMCLLGIWPPLPPPPPNISTSCAHKAFNESVPNSYISHLKSDIIENSRIDSERNSFASTFKLKLHLLLLYPSSWYICDFFLFHIEIEEKVGWIIGGVQRLCWPPSQIIGGGGGAPPFLRLWCHALD